MAAANELDMFGWQWLYKVIEKDLKSNLDIIVSITHFALIRRGFLCAGVGEDPVLPKLDTLSESLPDGWNAGSTYRLRYVHDKRLYLLSTITNDRMDDVVINLNRPVDGEVSGVTIKLTDVKTTKGSLEEILPNYKDIMKIIDTDLIEKLKKIEVSKEAQTQTAPAKPTVTEERRYSPPPMMTPPIQRPQFRVPLGIGSSDLNPFADGEGMLMMPPGMRRFDQRRDPTLPPGAIPPGARFDPIRPFGNPRPPPNRHPDHDHFPPPGYDDMFM